MGIELKVIDGENYEAVLSLKVTKEQEKFILSKEEQEKRMDPVVSQLLYAAFCPGNHPLAIYKDDVMVGFMIYNFQKGKKCGWLNMMMIDENHQNQGIGKLAIQKFITLFYANHEPAPLVTNTEIDNVAAIKLYEHFGFKKSDHMAKYGMEVDNVLMVLEI